MAILKMKSKLIIVLLALLMFVLTSCSSSPLSPVETVEKVYEYISSGDLEKAEEFFQCSQGPEEMAGRGKNYVDYSRYNYIVKNVYNDSFLQVVVSSNENENIGFYYLIKVQEQWYIKGDVIGDYC